MWNFTAKWTKYLTLAQWRWRTSSATTTPSGVDAILNVSSTGPESSVRQVDLRTASTKLIRCITDRAHELFCSFALYCSSFASRQRRYVYSRMDIFRINTCITSLHLDVSCVRLICINDVSTTARKHSHETKHCVLELDSGNASLDWFLYRVDPKSKHPTCVDIFTKYYPIFKIFNCRILWKIY